MTNDFNFTFSQFNMIKMTKTTITNRSTFSVLPYINKQKVKADGTTTILCRITIDGKNTALSTGISCAPQDWNAKKGEIRNVRDNGRLASFITEVKDKYNSLLVANGIITVEMLKAALKDKDTTGKFPAEFWRHHRRMV